MQTNELWLIWKCCLQVKKKNVTDGFSTDVTDGLREYEIGWKKKIKVWFLCLMAYQSSWFI